MERAQWIVVKWINERISKKKKNNAAKTLIISTCTVFTKCQVYIVNALNRLTHLILTSALWRMSYSYANLREVKSRQIQGHTSSK
jgi:hypothetical protein